MNFPDTSYFKFHDAGNHIIITYKGKIKNLPFIILLVALGAFLIFAAVESGDAFGSVFLIFSALISFVVSIHLLLIQINWALKIQDKTLFIRNQFRQWKELKDPVLIRTEAAYNTGKFVGAGRKLYYSRFVLDFFDSDDEKILLTTGGSFSEEVQLFRHIACKEFSKWLGEELNLKVESLDEPTLGLGEFRKTLY